MMNKKEITQFAKNIIRSQKGLRNRQLMHPRREWFVGIVVATTIFLLSAAWSTVKYFEYQTIDQVTVAPTDEQPAVYRQGLVESALSVLEEKAQRLEGLLESSIPVIVESEVEESEGDIDLSSQATSSDQVVEEGGPVEESDSVSSETVAETIEGESSNTPPIEAEIDAE